jgi:peroxiredoxin
MQGHKAVLFGVPDCGKVCSEQHVPSFLQRFNELRQLGVSRILCVAVGDEAAAKAWAQQQELADGSKIQVVTDPNAAFTRFMGMELAPPDAAGARSQRYAAVVDDGVLLKVCVDKSPAEARASTADTIISVLKAMH